MGYAVIAVLVLVTLALLSRLVNRHREPASFSAASLLHPEPVPVADDDLPHAEPAAKGAFGITVKLQQQIPGAPNTDVSTEPQVTKYGSATITRRTGRRPKTEPKIEKGNASAALPDA